MQKMFLKKNGIIIKLPIDGPENALNLASQFIKKFEDKKNYSIDLRVLDNIYTFTIIIIFRKSITNPASAKYEITFSFFHIGTGNKA